MAIKTSWATGDVLTATDISDTLVSKMSYALPTNAQTGTTYTAVLLDANKLTTLSNAAAVTVTIPLQSSVVWVANTVLRYTNLGAGTVTFVGAGGVTVTNVAATLAQYASADLIRTGSDAWTVLPFAGGSAAKATVTSTTGSPTITTVGGKSCYKFTGSGTIVIGTAGFVSCRVLAGGGGGRGSGHGGGGGAGGDSASPGGILNIFLAVGTYTVSIGAGGAAGVIGSDTYFASYYAFGGAGGGYQGATGGGSLSATTLAPNTGGGGQGKSGGQGDGSTASGGGGGATGVGANGSGGAGGVGGAGLADTLEGSSVSRGGGGGGWGNTTGGAATGGGGAGTSGATGAAGTANSGGGGGGSATTGGAGGSGAVVIWLG